MPAPARVHRDGDQSHLLLTGHGPGRHLEGRFNFTGPGAVCHSWPVPESTTQASLQAPRRAVAIWAPLIVLWVLWGSTYLGIAIVVDSLPPLIATGLRLIGGALLLATGLAITSGPGVLRIDRTQLAFTSLLGVGIPGMGLGSLALAERYVPTGISALVVSAIPLWIVLLRMRAGDRPSRATLAGVAIGLIGLVIMLLPGGTIPRSGTETDVLIWTIVLMAGTFSWAFFSTKSAGFPLPQSSLVVATYELLAAGAFQIGLGALLGERLDIGRMLPVTWIAWVALAVASAIGYATFTWLIARAPLSLVYTYAYVNPAVAVLLGALVLSEAITRDVVWGLIVVLGGVVLVVRGERSNA